MLPKVLVVLLRILFFYNIIIIFLNSHFPITIFFLLYTMVTQLHIQPASKRLLGHENGIHLLEVLRNLVTLSEFCLAKKFQLQA